MRYFAGGIERVDVAGLAFGKEVVAEIQTEREAKGALTAVKILRQAAQKGDMVASRLLQQTYFVLPDHLADYAQKLSQYVGTAVCDVGDVVPKGNTVGRAVVFMSLNGGAGKSTLAAALAAYLAEAGYSVALIDTDPAGGVSVPAGVRLFKISDVRQAFVVLRYLVGAGWHVVVDTPAGELAAGKPSANAVKEVRNKGYDVKVVKVVSSDYEKIYVMLSSDLADTEIGTDAVLVINKIGANVSPGQKIEIGGTSIALPDESETVVYFPASEVVRGQPRSEVVSALRKNIGVKLAPRVGYPQPEKKRLFNIF